MRLTVVVVGAGAFGGWTALELARRGANVRLIDAWGPGNARASSGGDTRVIRATYGSHEIYTRMAIRALELWRAHEQRYGEPLLRLTGALWLFARNDPFVSASAAALRSHGLTFEQLTPTDARRRYPQVDFTGIESVFCEPAAGCLRSRRACEQVAACLAGEGGVYMQAAVCAPLSLDGVLREVPLTDGTHIGADAFVFACGPWLASLFPDVVGPLVSATRQEVYYFGAPAGDVRFSDEHLPVWLEFGERFIYGIPGSTNDGFKIADDSTGPPIDPGMLDRIPTAEGVRDMRAFIARRFPGLAGAPLIRSEVCQYESTPDSNFILDRHPRASNVWIAGGGSGHGFKMGPAIGEHVASLVLGEADVNSAFALARFGSPPAGGWKAKWS